MLSHYFSPAMEIWIILTWYVYSVPEIKMYKEKVFWFAALFFSLPISFIISHLTSLSPFSTPHLLSYPLPPIYFLHSPSPSIYIFPSPTTLSASTSTTAPAPALHFSLHIPPLLTHNMNGNYQGEVDLFFM